MELKMDSENSGRAVQIIDFDEDNNLILKKEAFQEILKCASSRPVALISIVGGNREGKSFFLSQVLNQVLIRSLTLNNRSSASQQNENFTEIQSNLRMFESRSGSNRHTVGIWMWSTPITIRLPDQEDFDVILMDTQGFFDDYTNQREWSLIVGLSLLVSSCVFYNVKNSIKEDCLQNLGTFLSHTLQFSSSEPEPEPEPEPSLEQLKETDLLDFDTAQVPPFQNLVFLVRDWQDPVEYPFGHTGGSSYLSDKLEIKPHHRESHSRIRHQLIQNFDQIGCFLLPHPGANIMTYQSNAVLNNLDETFITTINQCISSLFETPTLIPIKRLYGWPSTFQPTLRDIFNLIELYVEKCNNIENRLIPQPESLYEVTIKSLGQAVVNKCVDEYSSEMFGNIRIRSGKCYFDEVVQDIDQKSRTKVFQLFERDSRQIDRQFAMGNEMRDELIKKIDQMFDELKSKNLMARNSFLIETHREALREYRAVMKTNIGFIDFVDDDELERFSNQADLKALNYFKLTCEYQGLKSTFEFLSDLDTSNANATVTPVESMVCELQHLLQTLSKEKDEFKLANQLKRSQVEKDLDLTLKFKLDDYRKEMEWQLASIFFIEETQFQNLHQNIFTTILNRFVAEKMDIKSSLAARNLFEKFKNKFESEIENIFESIHRKILMRNHRIKLRGSQIILDGIRMYEIFVEQYQGVDDDEFEKNHTEISEQVNDRLDRLFGNCERVKNEYLDNFNIAIEGNRNLALENLSKRKQGHKVKKVFKTAAVALGAGVGMTGLVVASVVAFPLVAGVAVGAAAIVPLSAATAAATTGVLVPAGAIAAGVGAGAAVGTAAGVGVAYKLRHGQGNLTDDEKDREGKIWFSQDDQDDDKLRQLFDEEAEEMREENLYNELCEEIL